MTYKPGEIVPQSGIYEELTSSGSKVTEVTCVKNEHFPPTEWNGYHYQLVHAAKHKPHNG
jgi:hypothetical protein